ncbi:MAG: hypothetical protein KF685_00920 [Acidobacteria bacterium]|nr:hypothetical protein [Acidobacteriota bacterium]
MNQVKGNSPFAGRTNLLIVIMLLAIAALGCLGPGTNDSSCEGTVSVNGRTYEGKAKDEEQAGLNACNKFCLAEDDRAKAMVRDWLASEAAKEFERKFKRKPTNEDAVIEDKAILDHVTRNCAARCKAEANKGRHTLSTNCH